MIAKAADIDDQAKYNSFELLFLPKSVHVGCRPISVECRLDRGEFNLMVVESLNHAWKLYRQDWAEAPRAEITELKL